MPLDSGVPALALRGSQQYQPLDIGLEMERASINKVREAQAQQAQQDMAAQQQMQQLAQQYGNDPDELVKQLGSRFPMQAQTLAEQIAKARFEGARAHKADADAAQAQTDSWLKILANTDENTWGPVRDGIVKQAPQFASVLPPQFSEEGRQTAIRLGTDIKDWAKVQSDASTLYLDGKHDVAAAILLANATTPEKRAVVDGLLKQAGLGKFSQLWQMPEDAQAFLDKPVDADKAADNARQEKRDEEIARHNRAEESLSAGNLGVRRAELARQIVKDQQPPTTEIAKLPAATAEKVAGVEQSLGVLADLQKMMDDPKSGIKARIGPAGGWMMEARIKTPGTSVDPSLGRFYAQTATLKNATIKAITGAQMSQGEAERILAQVPTMYDKPEVWAEKAATTKENLSLLRQRMLQLSGVNVTTPTAITEPAGKKRFTIVSVK